MTIKPPRPWLVDAARPSAVPGPRRCAARLIHPTTGEFANHISLDRTLPRLPGDKSYSEHLLTAPLRSCLTALRHPVPKVAMNRDALNPTQCQESQTMVSFPIHCRDTRIAAQTRTAPAGTPIGTVCVKGARSLNQRFEPLQAAARNSIDELMLADLIGRAINDNASQLYRGA